MPGRQRRAARDEEEGDNGYGRQQAAPVSAGRGRGGAGADDDDGSEYNQRPSSGGAVARSRAAVALDEPEDFEEEYDAPPVGRRGGKAPPAYQPEEEYDAPPVGRRGGKAPPAYQP